MSLISPAGAPGATRRRFRSRKAFVLILGGAVCVIALTMWVLVARQHNTDLRDPVLHITVDSAVRVGQASSSGGDILRQPGVAVWQARYAPKDGAKVADVVNDLVTEARIMEWSLEQTGPLYWLGSNGSRPDYRLEIYFSSEMDSIIVQLSRG